LLAVLELLLLHCILLLLLLLLLLLSKDKEMGGACSTYVGKERCRQDFGAET
jgi:hypothetical protein